MTDERIPRRLRLRYPTHCTSCEIALSKGTEAIWDYATRTAMCLACAPGDEAVDARKAGASAAAEGERRTIRKVDAVRRKYGDHAAVVAEALAARNAEATWGKGSDGEQRLASYIEREVGNRVVALYDRLIPGTRANIDLIYVAPTGVWVVDAKAYTGKVVKREVGTLFRPENEVFVGGRNRTKLAKGVRGQVDAVIAALKPEQSLHGIDVYGVICFVDSEWGLLDFPFQVGNVWVMYPGALKKRLRKEGSLSRERMERVARQLDLSLPADT